MEPYTHAENGSYYPIGTTATAPSFDPPSKNIIDINVNLETIKENLPLIFSIQQKYRKNDGKAWGYEFLLVILFGIGPTILGAHKPMICDDLNLSGMNISVYLLGLGIATLICHTPIFCVPCFYCNGSPEKMELPKILKFSYVLYISFKYVWLILGGVVLFMFNLPCIIECNSKAIYCVVIWCMWCAETLYFVFVYFFNKIGLHFH